MDHVASVSSGDSSASFAGLRTTTHTFDTKNVRQWGLPFNHVDAQSCALWHIPHNVHNHDLRDTCQPCRVLHHGISKLVKKATCVSADQKLARTSVCSNYPLKYLSLTSKAERVSKLSKERKNLAAKLSSVTHLDCDLNDKQHVELLEIVRSVNQSGGAITEELRSKGNQLLSDERYIPY